MPKCLHTLDTALRVYSVVHWRQKRLVVSSAVMVAPPYLPRTATARGIHTRQTYHCLGRTLTRRQSAHCTLWFVRVTAPISPMVAMPYTSDAESRWERSKAPVKQLVDLSNCEGCNIDLSSRCDCSIGLRECRPAGSCKARPRQTGS